MSDLDIARDIMAELATKEASQSRGWRWAKGVVVFPELQCPYCKEAVMSRAIWRHTDTSLLGVAILQQGRTPELGKPALAGFDHPHARISFSIPYKICFGRHGVTGGAGFSAAYQALFGALNGTANYKPFVIPFLNSDVMGNHCCETIQEWLDAGKTPYQDPDEEIFICVGCDAEIEGDYEFNGGQYCADCFHDYVL